MTGVTSLYGSLLNNPDAFSRAGLSAVGKPKVRVTLDRLTDPLAGGSADPDLPAAAELLELELLQAASIRPAASTPVSAVTRRARCFRADRADLVGPEGEKGMAITPRVTGLMS